MKWKPQTCECKFEVDSQFNFISVINICLRHAIRGISGVNLLTVAIDESRLHNYSRDELSKLLDSSYTESEVGELNNIVGTRLQDGSVTMSFDENGNLNISLLKRVLTTNEKNNINTFLNTRFNGKVRLI